MPETLKVLDSIFNPRSIAIIGASAKSEKLGNRILRSLLKRGFKGRIYPVNPNEKEVLGLTAYPSLNDISDHVDLAVIVVRASLTLEVMKQCGEKRVKGAIVISAGFSEAGSKKLQENLVEIARKGNVRIVGSNCEGIFNAEAGVDLTFAAKTP